LISCANGASSSSSSLATPSAPTNRYQAIRDYFNGGFDSTKTGDFCLALDVVLDVACDNVPDPALDQGVVTLLQQLSKSWILPLSDIVTSCKNDRDAKAFLVDWFRQGTIDILINHRQRLRAGNPWNLSHHEFDGLFDSNSNEYKWLSNYTEFSIPAHPVPNPSFVMIQTLFDSGFKEQLARWRDNCGKNLIDYGVSYSGTEPLLRTILEQFPEDVILESVITSKHWNSAEKTSVLFTCKPIMQTYVNQSGLSADMFLATPAVNKTAALKQFAIRVEGSEDLPTDSLALPVRVLRAFNTRSQGPNRAETTQADLIATGGEWGIDFERAPTKQEWRVIRNSLEQIGHKICREAESLESPFGHLANILFRVTPSWSVSPRDEDAYLRHRQNAFIGAAIAVSQKFGKDSPSDQWWENIGARVNLTATQAKARYEWLESQWQ